MTNILNINERILHLIEKQYNANQKSLQILLGIQRRWSLILFQEEKLNLVLTF